ncbi:hypothetical protein EJ05DRAFT_477042 [Pseudovirgaria hyperparasitica]|uniref:Uncharacterized protein n=1 Tax=Pseudovirgaria hyperparasitica TaxID=470096 RepID=A0A6A6W1L5_9PEZI|nr:uncharacterized protein EJ05DRAFT_477042 [Pseudovirgaria hyperparasitica]KAF2756802.1 hypothetical protein EJ05DRAFT_477042 [Pseudovirgaria hyperparasitica]
MTTGVYIVHVGGSVDNHTFTPNRTDTDPDDAISIISFVFGAGKHGVERSQWDRPCDSWQDYNQGSGYFASGFQPVSDENEPLIWNYTLDTTEPILFHCAAPGSCGKWGMVGTINPSEQYDINEQAQKAKEQYSATISGGTSPTASSTNTSQPTHHGLSTGAIVGIAVGIAIATLLLSGLAFFVWRHKRLARKYAAQQAKAEERDAARPPPVPMSPGMAPMSPNPATQEHTGFYAGLGQKQEYRSVYEQGPPGYDYKYGAVEGAGAGAAGTGTGTGTGTGVALGPDDIGAMRGMSMSPMNGYGGVSQMDTVHSRYSEVPGSEVARTGGSTAVELDTERR